MKLKAHETKHLNKISSFIHAISDRMIEDITEIMDGEYGLYEIYAKEHIGFYDFQLFRDYKIKFFPVRDDNVQLGFRETLTEYPNGFIHDKKLYLDESHYQFDDEDLAVIDEFYRQVDKRVMDWFNQCWIKAGGLDLTDHYRISIFNEDIMFDLKHQKWIDL